MNKPTKILEIEITNLYWTVTALCENIFKKNNGHITGLSIIIICKSRKSANELRKKLLAPEMHGYSYENTLFSISRKRHQLQVLTYLTDKIYVWLKTENEIPSEPEYYTLFKIKGY